MKLEEFLRKKRIDVEAFKTAMPQLWQSWDILFDQLGPQSFDQQKKFEFNSLRLSFPSQEPIPEKTPARPKPKLKKPGLTQTTDGGEGEKKKLGKKAPILKKKLPLKKAAPQKEAAETATKPVLPKKKLPLKKPVMKPGTEGKAKLSRPIMKPKKDKPEES